MGFGPRTGVFGFSTSPDKKTPGLSVTRLVAASVGSLGEAFHDPRTISTWLEGEVGATVIKVVLWADVASTTTLTTLPDLQVVEVFHPSRRTSGGYLGTVVPHPESQVLDEIYLAAYGRGGHYLGEASCPAPESGTRLGIGASSVFSATQFLGSPRHGN